MLIQKLDEAIRGVCPINHISIEDEDDLSTVNINFKDEATAQQKSDAQAVVEAFVYNEVKTYTPEEFFDEFTQEQWSAIKTKIKEGDINLEYLFDRLRVVDGVSADSQKTIVGVNYILSLGIINQDDVDRILGA